MEIATSAPARAERESLSYPLLLVTVSLGSIIAPLNSTMIAVALPNIREDFGVGHAAVTWLVSAYLIAMAVAQPLGGRLGDQLGRARVFRAGLIAFLGFSLAAAAAPSFALLVGFRALQALVGAAVLPNGTAMVRESVGSERLGEANGLTGSAIGLSAAVGPVLGAGLLGLGSWRYLFLMNIPLVAAALACLVLLGFRDRPNGKRGNIDVTGGVLLAAILVALTQLLGGLRGGEPAVITASLAVVLTIATALFFRQQWTNELPLAEWRLFRTRSYLGSTSYILLSNLVMYTSLLAIPFFIKEVQGRAVGTVGVLLGTLFIVMSVLTPVSGRLSDVRGRRLPAMAGAVCQLGGVVMLLAGIAQDVSSIYLAISLAVLGVGVGLGTGASTTAAIESAPRELAGSAAGTMSMMRYFGSIVGAGVLGGVLNTSGDAPGIEVFRALFAVLVFMAAGALAATFLIHSFHREPAAEVVPLEAGPAD